eukprot:scaffold7266_cov129-Isochrysis_galbana.AAC.2
MCCAFARTHLDPRPGDASPAQGVPARWAPGRAAAAALLRAVHRPVPALATSASGPCLAQRSTLSVRPLQPHGPCSSFSPFGLSAALPAYTASHPP